MNGAVTDLSLEPLGAGDLIDRAVRLYRRHFWTLIRISAPPVLISSLGWTIDTIIGWFRSGQTRYKTYQWMEDEVLALYGTAYPNSDLSRRSEQDTPDFLSGIKKQEVTDVREG